MNSHSYLCIYEPSIYNNLPQSAQILLCFAQHFQSPCSLFFCFHLNLCCFVLLNTSSRAARCSVVSGGHLNTLTFVIALLSAQQLLLLTLFKTVLVLKVNYYNIELHTTFRLNLNHPHGNMNSKHGKPILWGQRENCWPKAGFELAPWGYRSNALPIELLSPTENDMLIQPI